MKEGFYTMKFKFGMGEVTSKFGATEPFRSYPHTGIDYSCPVGTEIHAPVDGIVSAVRDYGDVNLGKAVFVKMKDGSEYVVGHLSNQNVRVGQEVHTGDLLGLSGNTGMSTGPHLHFGAFNSSGSAIDPGNIPWEAFQNSKEAFHQYASSGLTDQQISALKEGTHGFADIGSWLGDKVSHGAQFILEPVGDALGGAVKALFLGTLHALPGMLVCGGLICFILTIALGHHKPYFTGLGMWGLSAVIRGVILEAGL